MSQADAATLDSLVEGLADPTCSDAPSSRMLGKRSDSEMPLSVERLGSHRYSLTHYYEQNGDMMRDPDVEFHRDEYGRWFPLSFQQDGAMPLYFVAIEMEPEWMTWVYQTQYAGLRDFVRMWLQNLRATHGIR